jgi:DNA-binding transcriptional ArsR family regulator
MAKKPENELDDIIIKALGHPERKNILKIVAGYPEGVTYTGILGETGLSTGRLNYHLGELENFLDRGEDRLYRLSQVGEKAVATIEFINKDVDVKLLESVNSKRAQRMKAIRRRLNIGFYTVTAVMVGVTGMMGYFAYTESDKILVSFTGLFALFSGVIIYLTDRSRRRDPERILWIWEWLEWKLVGNYRNRD